MTLSWNEIRDRALAFSKEWQDESSEDAEAKSFWDAFFNVYGVHRRRVARFETPVKKSDGKGGFIDLLWKGTLLVEHKSRGKDLDRAFKQATDYFPGIKDRDLPRYVLVSDFARFRLYDLDEDTQQEFVLKDLCKNVKLFGFVAGYQSHSFDKEDPVNIKAAEQLGKLHDLLREATYEGHPLEVFLVRILFCLFADDTGIFEQRGQFREYIEQRTAEDGSDQGSRLAELFQVLNTPEDKRQKTLDEQLAAFPYVNGRLFAETLPITACNAKMRETLLDCSALDWSRISPAIFGSLFQSIMDKVARRNLGAHYTRELNILKALRPLFLDRLREEFERFKGSPKKLNEFQAKLAKIKVFDPACGCGNFLVIAYRELRLLELDVLRELRKKDLNQVLDVQHLIQLDVDQFYGIEIEEFPAQIAQVALWLTDHQMNVLVSEEFGKNFARLPLKKAPHVVHGNALRMEWRTLAPEGGFSFIVGNPPFIGKKEQNAEQKKDVMSVFHDVKGAGILDYVTCWYRKAMDMLAISPATRVAFVSTNSITQGEQVGILWPNLLGRGLRIQFAHRTFQWTSEAKGKAAVHCVIIGFALDDDPKKTLFDYESLKSEPQALGVSHINPYLVDGPDVVLQNRRQPICDVPPIAFGSMPNDGGFLLLSPEEKAHLVSKEPGAEKWLRPVLGSTEFINGEERWCLWLVGIPPEELRALPVVCERVERVKSYREASERPLTRELAATPAIFAEIRHPNSGQYLLIPSVSSERRPYIPIGFLSAHTISTNLNLIVPNATVFHFGILHSLMHMAWVRAVCGRLKSDYRYSAGIVYNNFPWPNLTDKQRTGIEAAAQAVLNIRSKFPKSSLAALYDPLSMPPELVKAHRVLDRAVDAGYGKTAFPTEANRVAYLFELYEKATSILPPTKKAKRMPRRKTRAV